MTKRQKLEIERSTKVQRLNALLDLKGDALTDELRSEMDGITTRMPGLEVEMRGAITAEAAEEAEARGQFGNHGDGEAAEVRQLLDRTPLTDYFGPASAGTGIEGRDSAELNAALKVPTAGAKGGPAVPWEVLEVRAFTTTARTTGRRCNGRSCNACSVRASWILLACGSIPCRPGVPNGRLSRAAWRRHRRRKATQRQRPSRRYSPTPT